MQDPEVIAFSERLNRALDLRNYPSFGRGRIAYVQEIFNISRAGANKWLHGKAVPHPRKRDEIAAKLNVSLSWLETGQGSPQCDHNEHFSPEHLVRSIPLITLEKAGYYPLSDSDQTEHVLVSKQLPQKAFATTCIGSAMEPKFSEKSILIIDPEAIPYDGDYVLARTPFFPEAIFRQYIKGSAGIYLVAINPKFEPIKIDTTVAIVGKVIESRSIL